MKRYRTHDLHIAEQAAEWQEALQAGGAKERAGFTNWLLESRRHVRNFLLMTAFDRELKRIDPERRYDVDKLLADAAIVPLHLSSSPLSPAHGQRARVRDLWSSPWKLSAAASLVILLAGLWLQSAFLSDPVHRTATGEQQTLKLDDGSIVYLNTQSRLQAHFTAQRREVRLLDGEALFVVAQDASRPFVVVTGSTRVQAVGTQFNVRRLTKDTVVSVVEGRVRIAQDADEPAVADAGRNTLVAGEEAHIADTGRIDKQPIDSVQSRLAWRQRLLEFRDQPLSEVVAEFNRYNRAPRFRIDAARLAARRYTGVFRADDPESLAQLLEQEGDIALTRTSAEILIRSPL